MRFVLDTKLLVSCILAAGLPHRLFDGAKAGKFELCASEVPDVFTREKFAQRLAQAGLTPQGIVDDIRRIAVVVSQTNTPRVLPTGPNDDHVIAATVTGHADLIASGDKRDLQSPGSFQGIDTVTAREAVERLHAAG